MVVPFHTATAAPPLIVVGNIAAVGSGTSGTGDRNLGTSAGERDTGGREFQQGQVLQAKVIGRDGDGRYTLEAGGVRVQVESRVPLMPGQTLSLRVMQGSTGFMLAVEAPDAGQFLTRSLATGGSGLALQTIFGGGLSRQAAQSSGQPQDAAAALTSLQQQFVSRSAAAPAAPPTLPQFSTAVNQFVNQVGQVMAPLLAGGRNEEALAQLAAGLRSLAPFFPPQQVPPGLDAGARQLFQTLSLFNRTDAAGAVQAPAAESAERALTQLVTGLAARLVTGEGGTGSPTAMLTSLQRSLVGLHPFVTVPAAFAGQSAPPTGGFAALFAWNLTAGSHRGGSGEGAVQGGGSLSSGEMLRELVQRLGLDMERQLGRGDVAAAARGLKFQLARSLETVRGAVETGEPGQLRRAGDAHQALQSIDFLQVLQANLDRHGIAMVPLPLPFLEQGFMTLDSAGTEAEAGDREEGARFSVLLKLSSLGNMRVDFFQTRDEVYIRFQTASPAVSSLLRDNQQELRAGLHPLTVKGPGFSEQAEDPLSILLRRCEGDGADTTLFSAEV